MARHNNLAERIGSLQPPIKPNKGLNGELQMHAISSST